MKYVKREENVKAERMEFVEAKQNKLLKYQKNNNKEKLSSYSKMKTFVFLVVWQLRI